MSADDMRRALEAERDAALEEVARLAAERDGARAEAAQIRATAGALTPGRIRVAALAAMTPAEIAAAPWWRWRAGLTMECGCIVLDVSAAGHPILEREAGRQGHTRVPDFADPLLPGWLLHLLRARTGDQTVSARHMPYYSVWWGCGLADRPDESRVYGEGPTEIDALLSALQGS